MTDILFSKEMLRSWQSEFIERYLFDRKTRSFLIAKPGTGKTLTALITAAEMIRNKYSDSVIVLSDRVAIKDQWLSVGNSLSLQFSDITNLAEYRKSKGYSITLQSLHNDAKKKLIKAAREINFFLIVDETTSLTNVDSIAEELLKVNPSTKFLFISSNVTKSNLSIDQEYTFDTEYIYQDSIISLPETKIIIADLSPSYSILEKVLKQKLKIDDLSWREFEILISQLLENDGYTVELMQGTKDGGVDVIASKELGELGSFQTLWQAKKKSLKNKVDLSIIRELADTRNEFKASKGIIVTTTYLTKDALQRVQRDKYILGKVDKDDLSLWIKKVLRGK